MVPLRDEEKDAFELNEEDVWYHVFGVSNFLGEGHVHHQHRFVEEMVLEIHREIVKVVTVSRQFFTLGLGLPQLPGFE